MATVSFGAMSIMGEAISRPPWFLIVARAGSTTIAASIRPPSSAAGIWSKASSTNSTSSGSPPAVRTEARTAVSLMFFRVLMATFLPSSSFADPTGLSPLTVSAAKSLPASPVEAMPFATARTGTLLDWAIISEVMLEKPNSNWPLTTPGTMAAPPCALEKSSFSPRSLKNPFF